MSEFVKSLCKIAIPVTLQSMLQSSFSIVDQIMISQLGEIKIRSGGNTRLIMVIDIFGTWCIGIPLCILAAYVFRWGIVGVYTLLTTEEIFRLFISLIVFKKQKWIISLS